ncbi:radiation-inducible immediate-early gene IEX-1 [Polymixia lowei]
MYSRSSSVTMSLETSHVHASYVSMMATRSKEPEIFTFERIPTQTSTVRYYAPLRPKRRCTRVMYPAKVRKYLPPAEKSPAKRWLLVLCLVVLWQIYTEEPCVDAPQGSADSPARIFQSAEEQARQLTDAGLPDSPTCDDTRVADNSSNWDQILLNTTCPSPSPSLETEMSRMYEQSTRNGYMVALLVYHRLGSDN